MADATSDTGLSLPRPGGSSTGGAPLASFVMAARNGAGHLAAAIESVLAQTVSDFELIVVDDGSTDATPAIVERTAAGDDRVRLVRVSLGSAGAARNVGWRAARGRYVAVLDQDDLAEPERLRLQIAFLAAHPGFACVGGVARIVDAAGREIGRIDVPTDPQEIAHLLPERCCFTHSTVTFRRSALDDVGGYRELPGSACEDYDLYLRLAERHPLANLGDVVGAWRVHEGNVSTDVEAMTRWSLLVQAAAKYRQAGLPDPLAARPLSRVPSDRELDESGVDEVERRCAVLAAHLLWGSLLTSARLWAPARAHLRLARVQLAGAEPADVARLQVDRARLELGQRHVPAGVRAFAAALLASPRSTFVHAAHPLARTLLRPVYRALPGTGGRAGRAVRDRIVGLLNRLPS